MCYCYTTLQVAISVDFHSPFFQNYEPEQIEIPAFLHQHFSPFVLWNKKKQVFPGPHLVLLEILSAFRCCNKIDCLKRADFICFMIFSVETQIGST